MAIKNAQQQQQQQQQQPMETSRTGPVRSTYLRQSYTPYHAESAQRTQVHPSPSSLGPTLSVPMGVTPSVHIEHDYDSHPPPSSNVTQGATPRSPFSSLAFTPAAMRNHDTGLSWLDSALHDGGTMMLGSGLEFSLDGMPPGTQLVSEQAQLLSLESPESILASNNSTIGAATIAAMQAAAARKEPQLEDVTTWANISHYISLYLQYLYPLLPLVHRPTFAQNLISRLDLRDTDFRALLLSIVAYTISQLPTSRLTTEQFDVEGLKQLQRRCHRTSQALQRTYHGQVSLTQVCIIIL